MRGASAGRVLWAFRHEWRRVLGFHFFMRLAGFALVVPLLTLLFRAALDVAGSRVISNFDIAAFLLSPAGAAMAVAMATAAVALTLAELAGLTFIADGALKGRAAGIGETLAFVAGRLPALAALATRMCLRIGLFAAPFALAGALAWFAWLGAHDVNYYLAERPPEWRRMIWLAAALAAGFAVVAAWQLARWLFALPILAANPGASGSQALAESARLTRGRLLRLVAPLAAWWLGFAALAAAGLWGGRALSGAVLDWAGVDVRRVLPVLALCLAVAIVAEAVASGLALAGQQLLVMRSYAEQAGMPVGPAPERGRDGRPAGSALRACGAVLAVAVLAAAGAWLAVSGAELRPRIEITAHRGASAVAPENTLAAFRAAIEAGADWIELDVQRTRDGRVVVLHDADLMRVGGDPRRVRELHSAELAGIDVGRQHGAQFAGERVPFLEDAIALVRGRAKLNVELKYNEQDPALAPAVVDLLRREGFLGQATVTSLDYAALRQVEAIEPRLATGHIVTAAVGDILASEADFLSVNAARATAPLVRRAHRAGKAVHVWTVNTPGAALELAERGVDNIITDDPAGLARLRAQVAGLGPHELLGLRLRALFGRPPRELADPASVVPL
jgi:glycerophosphoryl diester phosphodiesterase